MKELLVNIPIGQLTLEGNLNLPASAVGLVIFAHGSGSGRHSSRNRYVAQVLNQQNIATLLIDLLTVAEEQIDLNTRHLRFDIPMLAERLVAIATWTKNNSDTASLNLGYFGASTGGGAALIAAAQQPESIKAVVSRGGRPDLAGNYLTEVRAPTLLIVGGNDEVVLELNQQALQQLNAASRLKVIPHATHLFEEAGALEAVARLAGQWFKEHFTC